MKPIFNIMLLVCTVLWIGSMASCKHEHGPHTHTHNPDGSIDKSGPEWTSDYVCPMHCKGSGDSKKGTCPVCNMKLVKNKDKKSTGHEGHDHSGHDHDHSGHGHSHDHSGHDHDHGDHSGHDH